MKIVFFSDLHGNIEALKTFREKIRNSGYDRLIFCGDAIGYGYHANRVCDMLIDMKVEFVRGNHDQLFLDILDGTLAESFAVEKYGNSYAGITQIFSEKNILFIRNSVNKIEIQEDGLRIVAVHGTLDDNKNGRIYPDTYIQCPELYVNYDYVIQGHTHYRMCKECGMSVILNPGSLGQPRDGKLPSYLVLDTSKNCFSFGEILYSTDVIEQEIMKNEIPLKAEKMIAIWKRRDLHGKS